MQEIGDRSVRKSVLEKGHSSLSIRRQCELLDLPRSSFYYESKGETQENIDLMHQMDRHLTNHPTEGVNSLVFYFLSLGILVGPKRMRRLLKVMGRETIYRRKNLTKLGIKDYIKPYLLKDLKVTRANQVWCTDITYLPMKQGFLYLTAFIDVYSRKIVGWGLSNTMSKEWCLEVLEDAISRYGTPEIINSDQGSQYTSAEWQLYLEKQGIRSSMDGKGRALDNVWIERFWKSLKYDHVYLNPMDNGLDLWKSLQGYMKYYNSKIHHTLKKSPDKMYDASKPIAA